MAWANEQTVRDTLGPYEGTLVRALHAAWDDWRALQLGGRLLFTARSRACLVYDFIVQRLIAGLEEDKNVRTVRRDETVKFVIGERVVLRVKKANEQGLGSNIRTQATMDFVEQQQKIPGLPRLQKVEVVYVLNDLQTKIEQVLVVARNQDVRLWYYEIGPDRGAAVLSIPSMAPDDGGQRVRVKIRDAGEEQKNADGI
jgi:hypothetical protein